MQEEYIEVGKLDITLFEKIGQKLITDEVIFTYERINHVETKRIQLFQEVKNVLIKHIGAQLNLNVVLKVAILNDERHTKNSIITMIKIGKKTLNKITRNKKENLLFKKLDNYE